MKRIRLIALLILALSAFVSAANAEGGYAGLRGGVVNAKFADDDYDKYPWARTGFTAGAFIGKDFGKTFGFRVDVMYSQKGAYGPQPFVELDYLEFLTGPATNFGITQIKLDYLEVAPLFVARFPVGRFALRGFVGPSVGLWISAEAEDVILADGQEYRFDVDLGEIVEHWELGGILGVEFNAPVGPYTFLLEGRYARGGRVFEGKTLMGADLNVDVPGGEPVRFDVSNSTMSVLAGLMIPF